MTRIEVSRVVSALVERANRQDPPRLLHDITAECLVDVFNFEVDSAFEEAFEILGEVQRSLREFQHVAQSAGTDWTVEIYGTGDEYLRGASFADVSLPEREQEIRRHRRHVNEIRDEIRALAPEEFEIACTSILSLIGCEQPVTSPIRNDGGIDFYGRLHLAGRLGREFPYGGIDGKVGVWLIGQAKRYKESNPVQTAAVRELVGSVELARTRGAIHEWAGLELRPFDSVVQLFFTTGKFSAGAEKLLQKSGIISMNGEQLSVFLSDCGIGIDQRQDQFDSQQFRRDLKLASN